MSRSSPTANRWRWHRAFGRFRQRLEVEILADGEPPALAGGGGSRRRPARLVEILAGSELPALAAFLRHGVVEQLTVEILAGSELPALDSGATLGPGPMPG